MPTIHPSIHPHSPYPHPPAPPPPLRLPHIEISPKALFLLLPLLIYEIATNPILKPTSAVTHTRARAIEIWHLKPTFADIQRRARNVAYNVGMQMEEWKQMVKQKGNIQTHKYTNKHTIQQTKKAGNEVEDKLESVEYLKTVLARAKQKWIG
jgi:pantoate kinase